jgi:hypothetical protein
MPCHLEIVSAGEGFVEFPAQNDSLRAALTGATTGRPNDEALKPVGLIVV